MEEWRSDHKDEAAGEPTGIGGQRALSFTVHLQIRPRLSMPIVYIINGIREMTMCWGKRARYPMESGSSEPISADNPDRNDEHGRIEVVGGNMLLLMMPRKWCSMDVDKAALAVSMVY